MPAGLLLGGTTAAQARHVDIPAHDPAMIEQNGTDYIVFHAYEETEGGHSKLWL